MRGAVVSLCIAGVSLAIAACAPAEPTPAQIVEQAAAKASALTSVRFTLTRSGPPVLLDPATGARFTRASGEYQAPDRVHAKVNAAVAGVVLTIDMLWLPTGAFATNPFTGVYEKLPAVPGFDPRAMMGSSGVAATLREHAAAAKLVGKEKIGAADAYHLRIDADGAKLQALTGGVVVAGTHAVGVWVDVATSRVLRIVATEPGGAASWTLELSDFDKPVEIKGP